MSTLTPQEKRERRREFLDLLGEKDFRDKVVQKLKGSFPESMRSTRTSGDISFTGDLTQIGSEYTEIMRLSQEASKTVGESARQSTEALRQLREQSVGLFGDFETGRRSYQALSEQMLVFNHMQTSQQVILGKTVGVLSKFGIEMETTAQILDTAAMSFGMSNKEMGDMGAQLGELAYKFPGHAQKIAQNFQAAQSSLAYDSGKIMNVFKKLQETSSTTGVSFDRLTSAFGESMDSFQGSSEKAGKLNAILGKSIFNSVDLLGKTEAQRVDTIIKGVRQSIGGDVNRLGKFQLKAVADGMGLSVDETRRLLSGKATPDSILKDKKDPKTLLQEQANRALEVNSGNIAALTTVMKSYAEPLELIYRDAAATSRKAATQAIAQAAGMQNITSLAEILQRLMNFAMTGGETRSFKLKPEDKAIISAITSTESGDVKLEEAFNILKNRFADVLGDFGNKMLKDAGILKEGETLKEVASRKINKQEIKDSPLLKRIKELNNPKQNQESKEQKPVQTSATGLEQYEEIGGAMARGFVKQGVAFNITGDAKGLLKGTAT